MSNSPSLIAQLDDLIAASETADSPGESYIYLKKAIRKTCAAMHGLVRELERIAMKVLKLHGLDDPVAELTFRDRVLGNKSLAHFASPEALEQFLSATNPVLVHQLNGTGVNADHFTQGILRTYESFMDQKVSAAELVKQSERLERFFCRPPQGGSGYALGGPPLLPGGSGTEKERKADVIQWIITAAAVVSAVAAVITIFALAHNETAQRESESSLGLLTLLTLAGFAAELDSRGELPARRTHEIKPPQPAKPTAAQLTEESGAIG